MRTLSALLLGLCLLVSGCAGSDPKPASTEPGGSFDALPTDETGVITGLVTDTELQPIQGAVVAIKDRQQTMTDAEGRFALSDLEPGDHTVYAQAIGYNSVARNATVAAGETTDLSITLDALPTEGPHHETKPTAGHICGQIHVAGSIFNTGNLPCGGQGSIFVPFTVNGDLYALVAEMTWTKNSGLTSNELDLRVWQGGSRSGTFTCTHCYGPAKGKSPIRLEVSGPFAGLKDVAPDQTANFDNVIYVPADSSNPTGVNIVFDQRTTIYDSLFYGGAPPPGFTALPDR